MMLQGLRCRRAIAALFLFLLTGCQPAMTTPMPPAADALGDIVPNEFPLRFSHHGFDAYCYNTIGCRVVYNHFPYYSEESDDGLSGPPIAPDYKKHWGGSSEIGIDNFPPPALVKWKSLDGVAHEAEVDIGTIFKDRKILHHVPEQEVKEGAATDIEPDIFLEVNDRTINVYMQAWIPTKQGQIPGHMLSHHRNDLILAWSRTY